MLVADSSRAHFHQTLNHRPRATDDRTAAASSHRSIAPPPRRGHTLVFPTSRALNACPYLAGPRIWRVLRGVRRRSASPGKTVGVIHATGPDGAPPTDDDIRYLEITSRRASERIAMLRAFAKSETQARSDPLTGLWNRRSLENRVRDLHRDGIPYALAYGDLDHFKILNDTHGHEAGDQALRLFARVLRDSVRPDDIAARYGGEEFVIVLPDCATETATSVLERATRRLALALTDRTRPGLHRQLRCRILDRRRHLRRSRRHRRSRAPRRQSRRPQPRHRRRRHDPRRDPASTNPRSRPPERTGPVRPRL